MGLFRGTNKKKKQKKTPKPNAQKPNHNKRGRNC